MKQAMPRKQTVRSLCKQIETCKNRISVERDKLRDLISEVGAIADNCDDAVLDLERATDTLSQYL